MNFRLRAGSRHYQPGEGNMKKQDISLETFKKSRKPQRSFLLCPQLPINKITRPFKNSNNFNHRGNILCPQLPVQNNLEKQEAFGNQ